MGQALRRKRRREGDTDMRDDRRPNGKRMAPTFGSQPPALSMTDHSGNTPNIVRFERMDIQRVQTIRKDSVWGRHFHAIADAFEEEPEDYPEKVFYYPDWSSSNPSGKVRWIYYSPSLQQWDLFYLDFSKEEPIGPVSTANELTE